MKKLFLLLVTAVTLVSCSEKHELSLHLESGKTYLQKVTSVANVAQTVNGQNMEIQMTVSGEIANKVMSFADGIYTIEVSYKSLDMEMTSMMGQQKISSTSMDTADLMSSLLRAMIDAPFTLKMTEKGKIEEVSGLDAMLLSVLNNFPQLNDQMKEGLKAQLSDMFGAENIAKNLEMSTNFFPTEAVAIGDEWSNVTTMKTTVNLEVVNQYKLKEMTDEYYVLSIDGTLKTAGESTNASISEANLSGTQLGEMKVNRKTGWVETASIAQNFSGNIKVQANMNNPEGMEIPMEFRSDNTIEGSEL